MSSILTNKKTLEWLFLAWLITLPFGSSLGGISFGFFTLYPNLLFSIALLAPLPWIILKWPRLIKLFTSFLLIWLVYGVIFAVYNGKSESIIFDVRSLGMQLVFALGLFSTYTILGWEKFKDLLVVGLRCFLFVLLFFGFFEFYTGIHLEGNTTAKLYFLPVNFIFYAPLFTYDNPNDFLLYCIFILLILLTFDDRLRNNRFVPISIALLIALFTICAYSRLANFILTIIIIFQLFQQFLVLKKRIEVRRYIPYAIVGVLMFGLLLVNPLFIGPKYSAVNKFQKNELDVSGRDSMIIDNSGKVVDRVPRKVKFNEPTADQVRMNLILNGLDLIKEQPILGVGPGQFRQRHEDKKVERNVGTVLSPHNFVIEIVSQFGIFGWAYLLFVAYAFYQLVLKKWKVNRTNRYWMLIVFISIPIMWLMPSGYLYQAVNWLLLPLLLIEVLRIQKEENVQ
jgi:hypothetical protein|tara:strand:- start:13812 stop:15170 length:1359 start_codon:yes stop_codon:yes gene_type:complete